MHANKVSISISLSEGPKQSDFEKAFIEHEIDAEFGRICLPIFHKMGFKSIDDFKNSIPNENVFTDFMDNFVKLCESKKIDVPWIYRWRMKNMWHALVPNTKKQQLIPMGPEERKSLELLGKYMKFIQNESKKIDDYANGAKFEAYCNRIKNESALLHEAIRKREKQLIQEAVKKFSEIKNDCKVKQREFEKLALSMDNIKKKCDNALGINEFEQLEERRNIICSAVSSAKKQMDDAMSQSVDGNMKSIKMNLSDFKPIKEDIGKMGKIYIEYPFDLQIKNVKMNKNKFRIFWQVKNGQYLYNNCNEMSVSVIKHVHDDKKCDDNVVCIKKINGDLSIINCAEIAMNKNDLKGNCLWIFRVEALGKIVEKGYKYESGNFRSSKQVIKQFVDQSGFG